METNIQKDLVIASLSKGVAVLPNKLKTTETNIQKALVIVNFSCERGGSATKLDFAHASKYEKEYNIKNDGNKAVSRTYIDLYGDAQETFKQPEKIYKQAWAVHQKYTIAKSGNDTLLAVKTLTKHNAEMETFKQEFIDAVQTIKDRFIEMRDNSIAKYNGKLDINCFPLDVEEVANKFSWNLTRKTLPDVNALDDALDSKELEQEIRDDVSKQLTETYNSAIQNVITRLGDFVKNILNQANGGKAIGETTLTNFAEFMKMLPDLNISGCPKIQKAYENSIQLLQYDASATADQSVKDDLIEKSKSILNDLDAIGYGKKI